MSAIPVQTPENWTTIATGSYSGTHGVAVWGRHYYGEPVTEKHGNEAMSSNLCRAEYIWEAASRQGLRAVLYCFIGYPPTTKDAVFIDWFRHPSKYYFELSPNAVYVSYIDSLATSLVKVKLREVHNINVVSKKTVLFFRIMISIRKSSEKIIYDVYIVDSKGRGGMIE